MRTATATRFALAAATLTASTLLAAGARAEESGVAVSLDAGNACLSNALEVAVGLGSAQGYGSVAGSGPTLGDLGVGFDASVGWRVSPRWMVGLYSATSVYPATAGSSTWSTSAGVQVNRHFDVTARPWVGLGAGWHGYWLSQSGGTTSYQGLDLARVQVGVQAAVTPAFSLDPFLGVTLSTFLTQKGPAATAFADLTNRAVSVQVMAGLIGRFDLFGRAQAPAGLLASNVGH
jgi:hypothetical protein